MQHFIILAFHERKKERKKKFASPRFPLQGSERSIERKKAKTAFLLRIEITLMLFKVNKEVFHERFSTE